MCIKPNNRAVRCWFRDEWTGRQDRAENTKVRKSSRVSPATNVALQSSEQKTVINMQWWDNHTPTMNGIRPSSYPIPSPKSVPAQSPKSGRQTINLKENIGEYV